MVIIKYLSWNVSSKTVSYVIIGIIIKVEKNYICNNILDACTSKVTSLLSMYLMLIKQQQQQQKTCIALD